METLPKTIINKISFLNVNGFKLNKDIKTPYKYDYSLITSESTINNHNILLEYNINKHSSKKCSSKNFIEYWKDHYFFINTFEKEKKIYDKFGIDNWILHFIKEVLPTIDINKYNTLDKSFIYPQIIGYELNENLLCYPFEIELLGKNKYLANKLIITKKYKWADNSDKIKKIIESLNNNNDNNNNDNDDNHYDNNCNSGICFCKSPFMEYLITNEKNSYNPQYSDTNLRLIHDNYCHYHSEYLKTNEIQFNMFMKFKTDNWIEYLKSNIPTFTCLVNNKSEYYNLHLFDYINLL
jgi:hypothetical protein